MNTNHSYSTLPVGYGYLFDVLPFEWRELLRAQNRYGDLMAILKKTISSTSDYFDDSQAFRNWVMCSHFYRSANRLHESLGAAAELYCHILDYQDSANKRIHKGDPLHNMAEAYALLGYPIHSKRCLLLAACEDAITNRGRIDPRLHASYQRLAWDLGIRDEEIQQFAGLAWNLYENNPDQGRHPEYIAQSLEGEHYQAQIPFHDWITGWPSAQEVGVYSISGHWASYLNGLRAKDKSGQPLERLAHYLISCMPGCRAYRRKKSRQTDYDVAGCFEGVGLDFRVDFGRYFLCECKDWSRKANFSTLAKFAQILKDVGFGFGILFSKEGITGKQGTTDARREVVKVYQQERRVIVVVTESDLKSVISGSNFTKMLRSKYEAVRLDL
jgi:hypothetical protein